MSGFSHAQRARYAEAAAWVRFIGTAEIRRGQIELRTGAFPRAARMQMPVAVPDPDRQRLGCKPWGTL